MAIDVIDLVIAEKEITCYGVDVGKLGCVVARRNEQTPAKYRQRKNDIFSFENDAEGFGRLLSDIREHGGPESCCVLHEPTGHYSATLRQFLREHHIPTFTIQPKERYGKQKTDKRDARALADILYNQLVLGAIPADEREHAHSRLPPIAIAKEVHGLIHRLCERIKRRAALYNKLEAVTNQIFPEFGQIYKTHSPSSITIREKYPTPQAIASASLNDLCSTRLQYKPGRAQLEKLQELARNTVGLRDPIVVDRLLFEQEQIIEELRLLDRHVQQLEERLFPLLDASREGQILMSFPGVGHIQCAILLASIGNFDNFECWQDLCGLAGWRPYSSQTGITYDSSSNLRKTGNMQLKGAMSLIAFNAIRLDDTWRALYDRLIKRKCHYDQRRKIYVGKMKVVGRVAGQMLRVMFTLIVRDRALVESTPPDKELPPPQLYQASKHLVKMK